MTIDLILLGAAISLDPLPLGAYILLLGSRNGTRKGFGFTAGWVLCLAAVSTVTLLVTGGRPPRPNTAPSTVALVVQIVAGAALLAMAWRQRRRVSAPKPEPRWQSNLDRLNVFAAAGIAALLQPWVMVGASAATLAQLDLAKPAQLAAVVVFGVLATSSYLTMQAFAILRPATTLTRLQGLNQWINDHRNSALVAVYVIVGLWLIGRAGSALL